MIKPYDPGQLPRRLALSLVIYTLAVILWGAFVRMTGSGAGCADHWPLCNGQLVPRPERLETLIEFTHRVTSSLAGVLSIVVLIVILKRFPRGHVARTAALWSLGFMLLEGALGALLVKLELVADDTSLARAVVVGIHLINTLLLLAAQWLTYHFSAGGGRLHLGKAPGGLRGYLALGAAGLLLLGGTGAVTALGDTLFPARTLAEGLRQDLDSGAHFLVRLRVLHPILAIAFGAYLAYFAGHLRSALGEGGPRRAANLFLMVFAAQIALGALNVLTLAPMTLQLLHLLVADLLWLAFIHLAAQGLAVENEPEPSMVTAGSTT